MAEREFLALNEDTSRLEAPQAGDTYVANRRANFTLGIDLPAGQDIGGAVIGDIVNLVNNITVDAPINLNDALVELQLSDVTMRLYPQGWDHAVEGTMPALFNAGEALEVISDATVGGQEYKSGDLVMARVQNPNPNDTSDYLRIPTGNGILTVAGVAPDAAGNVAVTIDDLAPGTGGFLLDTDINTLAKLNALVGDANLDDVSAARPAQAHTHSQQVVLNYTFSPRDVDTGYSYLGGFYDFSTDDANLIQGGTVTIGDASNPHGAYAFAVFGAANTNGTTVTVTVSGASIDDNGLLTPGDSEVLFTGAPGALNVNQYYQTTKRWAGTVTYTLTTDGTAATCDFNYGLCQYERMNSDGISINLVEIYGMANTTDAAFDVEVIKHDPANWTYAATGFDIPNPVASMAGDYGAFAGIVADNAFSWRRGGPVDTLDTGEGVILRINLGVNRAVSFVNAKILLSGETGSTGP